MEASSVRGPAPNASRRREIVLGATALLFLLITAGVAMRLFSASAPQAPALRSEFWVPPDTLPTSLVAAEVSPDGQKLAFVVTAGGKRLIWVRALDSTAAQSIPSSDGTSSEIFWSADSQYIGFFAEGKLKKVAAGGGPAQVVSNLPGSGIYTGTWNTEGAILISSGSGPVLRISATGGDPSPVTELDTSRKETA